MDSSTEEAQQEGIAIVGMAGRFPGAGNLDEFWDNLKEGVESITFFSDEELEARGLPRRVLEDPSYVKAAPLLDGVDLFDAGFFGLNPNEARIMDPQHRLSLECAWEALENAGCDPAQYDGSIGVYLGVGSNTYLLNVASDLRLLRAMGGQAQLANDKDHAPTRVSYKLNLKGPSVDVQTACSTALVAVHLASEALESYHCDMALAGATRIHTPQDTGYSFQPGGIHSPDGHCRAFDAGARGTVFGNGQGIVVLKRLADALADGDLIYAVIKGSAINNDGAGKVGYTAPGIDGQRDVIAMAQAIAGIDAETISYVEAHGTGTELGDPVEISALTQAFRLHTEKRGFCAIGSVKTNIGHSGTAAGAAGLIKTALALKHALLPPSLHFEKSNPTIDFESSPFYVNTELRSWRRDATPRRAGVSSFGIGGTNAHAVLEEPPPQEPSGPSRPVRLLVLSARTPAALEAATDRLAEHLRRHDDLELADVAYTLQRGRAALSHRRTLVCRDLETAVAALAGRDGELLRTEAVAPGEPVPVFLFPGQGAQHVGMAAELYQGESVFRHEVDRCAERLEGELGLDLRRLLYPGEGAGAEHASRLTRTELAQPALFVVEYALARLFMEWGVRPQAMIGHSIGEYVAACLAGVLSLDDALTLVAARGKLMGSLPGGAMLAVSLPESEVVAELGDDLSLAAVNGPALSVVSGPGAAVDALAERLGRRDVEARRLHTSHAFHSAAMDPILEPFRQLVRRVELAAPEIPYVSNLTGQPITAEEATDPDYWARHLRQTVRFSAGLGELLANDPVLLEVGPGRTLTTLARRAAGPKARVLASLPPSGQDGDALESLITACGGLWRAGVPVDWGAFYAGERRRRVVLPTYPFERRRYWIENRGPISGSEAAGLPPVGEPAAEEEAPAVAEADPWSAPAAPVNEIERRIVEVWREALGFEEIGRDSNFFELGGHSLLLVQLGARLGKLFEVELPIRLLAEAPTAAELAVAVAELQAEQGTGYVARLLPEVVPDPAGRHEPFPLTEVQEAYWIGRRDVFQLGRVATHSYREIELQGLDTERLARSWRRLIERHAMLRTIVLPDGRQRVLEEVPPYEIRVLDLTGQSAEAAESGLGEVRAQMSHQVLPADRWPLFEMRVTHLDDGRRRLHLSIDMLIADAWSLRLLSQEMARLYFDPEAELPPIDITFRDYLLSELSLRDTEIYRRSLEYWQERVPTLPLGPDLPLARDPSTIERPRFVRRSARLSVQTWDRLRRRATRKGLTPSGVLMAAYAEILTTWSKSPHFLLNLTLFNRLPLHPHVGQVIGDFTSLVLLEVDNSAGGTFEDRARRLQAQLWEDLERRYVSGVQVLRQMLRRHGGPPRLLAPVIFTSNLNQRRGRDEEGETIEEEAPLSSSRGSYGISQTPQVWLDHVASEHGGALHFTWDAVEELFPDGLLQSMFDTYRALLERLAGEEAVWSEGPLQLVPEEQLSEQASVNATGTPLPEGRIHDGFVDQALRHPDRPAVMTAGAELSYGQLLGRSLALARRLRELEVRPDRLVAVVMEKGWEQVVGVLGILQAGAAYLPIDASLPRRRLWQLLEQGEARLVVTQARFVETIEWPGDVRVVACPETEPAEDWDPPADPVQGTEDLAYVIFTSGSTGVPKGVMIDHRAALNTLHDVNRRFRVGPQDRVLAISNLNFDLSVFDVFGTLAAGGALVLPDPGALREPAHWAELIERRAVTLWNSVPALMQMLVDHVGAAGGSCLETLRLVLLSGDWIPVTLPAQVRDLVPQALVVSLGGATEASIWSILYPIAEVDPSWTSIPYGTPMANQSFHVLDSALRPRPTGVPGELYIGGVGVARGYWRDEARTRERFVDHPQTGERLYRTGDLGRYLPGGDIEFLGREDFQVKIGGHRIELGEIEAVLARHPDVRGAAVTARGQERGEKSLVAYVVPRDAAGPAPEARAEAPAGAGSPEAFQLIRDPIRRLEFKTRQLGLMPDRGLASLELEATTSADGDLVQACTARRSRRRFHAEPIAFGSFAGWLRCLRQVELDGKPKYAYPSAGSLYPVQTFLYVKPGRVDGIAAGAYYYHPSHHRLWVLSPEARISPEVFTGDNRPIFESAAFALFLVARMKAIEPLYGPVARDFSLLEAGYMGQLLMSTAPGHEMGLCPIGTLRFDRLRAAFGLEGRHEFLHCLLGGLPDAEQEARTETDAADYELLRSLLTEEQGDDGVKAAPTAAPPAPAAAPPPGAGRVRQLEGRGELVDRVRSFLSQRLPDYMVPATVLVLDALPLSANGKVDRQALPEPEEIRAETPFVAPRDPLEKEVARCWAEILGKSRVGLHDDFFELGGHSLLAARLTARLRDVFEVEVPLATLFASPTVAALAGYLGERTGRGAAPRSPAPAAEPGQRHEPFPLLDLQEAYWIGATGNLPLSCVPQYCAALEMHNVDLGGLKLALERLVERHEMLRARVLSDGRQQILPDVTVPEIEVSDLSGKGPEALERFFRERVESGFDLDRPPLLDVAVVRLDDASRIVLRISLLICDAASFTLLRSELQRFYTDPRADLPAPGLSYRDYVLELEALEEEGSYRRARDYWLSRLESLPPAPELPLARDPSSLARARLYRRTATLEARDWERFSKRARQAGVTADAALAAAYTEVLATWSKRRHFCLNVLYSNRHELGQEAQGVIGNFSSTFLLEVDLRTPRSFQERTRRLQEQLWRDVEHSRFSGLRVLRELNRVRGGESQWAMPIVFASTVALDRGKSRGAARSGRIAESEIHTPQVWLDHQAHPSGGGLRLNWDAVEELFPPGLAEETFAAYRGLLARLSASDEAWQEVGQSLVPASQLAIRADANATDAPFPPGRLHEPFLAQVAERPGQPAVIADDGSLTYAELARRARQTARRLEDLGAEPGRLVAVVLERGWRQAVAVLGVLEAGAAYLPISPDLPRERLWYLLEHGEVQVALTDSGLDAKLRWPASVERLRVDEPDSGAPAGDFTEPRQTPDDLAYVIYTSGSTGLPKGVMIEHRAALNTVVDLNRRFRVGPGDRVLMISSLSFDLSVYDLFGTLAAGGTLVLPAEAGVREPARWVEWLAGHGVTIWSSVPALAEMLVDHLEGRSEALPDCLRLVFLSGDWIPVNLPERIRALRPGIEVISLGGATEASIWSIVYPIAQVDPGWTSIPYGKPLANQRFHVLDDAFEPCPVWVPGQLFIAGAGLARGYWRDREKTEASFLCHPRSQERLYRTGDLGRYLPDGNIEFLGREDLQVKVQGYRIELGEIEAALVRHPEVRTGAVVAVGEKRGNKRLVACYVAEKERRPEAEELRRFLQQKLPEYMVPHAFMALDALPLTFNGKVDRGSLAARQGKSAGRPHVRVAARDEVELELVKLWEEVLEVDSVGVTDDFFELGGHSLSGVRLMSGIRRRFDRDLPLSTLFDESTVEHQARLLRSPQAPAKRSALVRIRSEGSGRPFFCVHPVGGSVLCYADLARHLGPDRPFFGLQTPELDGAVHSVEEMATCYLEAVREVQPRGPYLLGGWSMGGVVAFEMARQLDDRGESAALVAMLDVALPKRQAAPAEELDDASLIAWFARDLGGLAGVDLKLSPEELRPLATAEQLGLMAERTRSSRALPPDVDLPAIRAHLDVFQRNARALASYVPRPYAGPLELFQAKQEEAAGEDLARGWAEWARGPVELYHIEGNHYTIMRAPHVEELARRLRVRLKEAGGR